MNSVVTTYEVWAGRLYMIVRGRDFYRRIPVTTRKV